MASSSSNNWRSRSGRDNNEGPSRFSGGSRPGDNWRSGGGSRPASTGERPRLNLKPRGAGGSNNSSSTTPQPPTEKLSNLSTLDKEQPPPTNSRAAAFGAAPSGGGGGMRRGEVCKKHETNL